MPRAKTWRQLKAEGMFATKGDAERPPVRYPPKNSGPLPEKYGAGYPLVNLPRSAKHLTLEQVKHIGTSIAEMTKSPSLLALQYKLPTRTIIKIWKEYRKNIGVPLWENHRKFRDRKQQSDPEHVLTREHILWIKNRSYRNYTMHQNRQVFYDKFTFPISESTWRQVVSGRYKKGKGRPDKDKFMKEFFIWCQAKFPDLDQADISKAISMWVKSGWCPIGNRTKPPDPAPPCPNGKSIRAPRQPWTQDDENSVRRGKTATWTRQELNEGVGRFVQRPLPAGVFADMREGRWWKDYSWNRDLRLQYAGWQACRRLWRFGLNSFEVNHYITHGTTQGLSLAALRRG